MNQQKPDINRLLEFQRLLLQLQAIQRKVHIPPSLEDTENDAEHSYGTAMVGWYLAQYFPELDRDKIIRLGLAHDLVEIHAGDTFSYGEQAHLDSKAKRERAAFERLKDEWPDFPEIFEAIQEYEALQSTEAKFVYALDKLLPAMIDYTNDGRDWQYYGITHKMFKAEKDRKVPISPEINNYMDQLHAVLAPQLHLFASDEETKA